MEYEISDDGEELLFDDSTNPSLKHEDDKPASRTPRKPSPQADPADKDSLQTAELIPEEEHQLA